MRVVNLARTGVYVVMDKGALVPLNGRIWWPGEADARAAARQENAVLSDRVLRTLA